MKQNIYDDPAFFSSYQAMRSKKVGLHEFVEQPAMLALMPDVRGATALDLGCGAGGFCRKLIDLGCTSVIGVDISSKMLEVARRDAPAGIEFHNVPLEEFDWKDSAFDLVVSSLALHYLADLDELFRKVHQWLKSPGAFLFSTEHPLFTCAQGIHPHCIENHDGHPLYWPLDCYSHEGRRESHWFVDGVVRYHRTMSTILNSLIHSGFTISTIREPVASAAGEQENPDLKNERRRPTLLIVKAVK